MGSCPEGAHDISVFLGSGLSPQLEAFMCSKPLLVYGSPPTYPRCFRHPKLGCCRAELKPNSINTVSQRCRALFLAKYFQTFPKQSRRIAHVKRLFRSFKANAPVSVFLFSQHAPAQTRWPQKFGTVLSFVRLRQVASLVRIYSSAPLARCKQAKFYSANTAPGVTVNANFERYQVRQRRPARLTGEFSGAFLADDATISLCRKKAFIKNVAVFAQF